MRPVIKGLLIGCAALLVVAGIAVFVAVRFLRANKGRLQAHAAQVRAQGREFGQSATVVPDETASASCYGSGST